MIKMVKVIPADGWVAVFINPTTSGLFRQRIPAFALVEDEDLEFNTVRPVFNPEHLGHLYDETVPDNFLGVCHVDEYEDRKGEFWAKAAELAEFEAMKAAKRNVPVTT